MIRNVFLAGGLYSGWQKKVMEACPTFTYFNPEVINDMHAPYATPLDKLALITKMEREAIRKCDIIFAYLERGNPSGLGLSAELGYGRAHHKYIIFVDERADGRARVLRTYCDFSTDDLQEGLKALQEAA